MAKQTYSKLAKFKAEERQRAISANPSLLNQLTPTEIALLFPDYFKRGTPDVGGFREAISQETARKQGAAQQDRDKRLGWLEQMRQQYSSTTATGNLKQNQQEAYKAARAEGLSDSAARILVANMSGESLKNPGDHHWDRSHMSQGIVQWDPQRAERIRGQFGAYPKDMSVAQQTKAAIWEMKTYYKPSWDALNDEQAPASIRMHTLVSDYERPQDVGGSVTSRMQYYNGLNITDDSTATAADKERAKQGATPAAGSGGQTAGGMSFNVKSGYIVPKDDNLYDPRNAQQCATLGKAFNPSIGRSNGWTIVDGDIKAGQVVATKQYNNGGADRVGAGYHTGVALTAPNNEGKFLLLEQFNGQPARTRWVSKDSYPIPGGGTTSFGLISSGGKVHDEVSQEALEYGKNLAPPEQRQSIGTNAGTPGVSGEVAAGPNSGPIGGSTIGPGEEQSASLIQPAGMMPNLMNSPMNMMMGMMGGFGGMQSATPMGLVTTALGFIMPLIGSFAGERLSGEGMGDAPRKRYRHIGSSSGARGGHHRSHQVSGGARHADSYSPSVTTTGLSHKSNLVGHDSVHAAPAIGATQQQYNAFREAVASIESRGGNYNLRGGSSNRFAGAYQMGGGEIREVAKFLGEQAPVAKMKGSRKFAASDTFLNDPKMQERYFDVYVMQHHNYLMKNNKQYAAMNPEERLKVLGYAHNQGAGGANKWLRTGSSKSDAFGTDATKYAYRIGKQFEGLKVAQAEAATRLASAQPTTPAVGPGPSTPGGASPATPAQMAKAPTLGEKMAKAVGFGSPAATAAPSPAAITPKTSSTPVTPTTTSVTPSSTSIEATPAPTGKFSREARNTVGIYSTPARNDIMSQFAKGKNVSATVMPNSNVSMPAPGPAPDMASMQMNQLKGEVTALAAQQQSTPAIVQQRSMEQAPSQGFNPDQAMKQIAQPYNTPSFHRAMTRAYGNETPGEVGQNHFSYGNAR